MFGIIIAIGLGMLGMLFVSLDETNLVNQNTGIDSFLKIDNSEFKKAPNLVGIAHYLNTTPEELTEKIEDSVVLYDIWTYSCIRDVFERCEFLIIVPQVNLFGSFSKYCYGFSQSIGLAFQFFKFACQI